jgi:TM2 domain-containing membrane protein YozV
MPTSLPPNFVQADGLTINLKNRVVAAVLAFLFPGAGHLYQGRLGKAGLFSTCILILFVMGLILGGGRCVYASWIPQDYRWHYILQAGVGLPAAPAAIQWYRDKEPVRWWGGFMARPNNLSELSEWQERSSAGFDLGTLYTMVAGLLNILVIFDAYGGPMPIPHHESRKKKKPDAPT